MSWQGCQGGEGASLTALEAAKRGPFCSMPLLPGFAGHSFLILAQKGPRLAASGMENLGRGDERVARRERGLPVVFNPSHNDRLFP